jgi:hypothetical protein
LESFVEQAMVEYCFSGIITERRGNGSITAFSGAMPSNKNKRGPDNIKSTKR